MSRWFAYDQPCPPHGGDPVHRVVVSESYVLMLFDRANRRDDFEGFLKDFVAIHWAWELPRPRRGKSQTRTKPRGERRPYGTGLLTATDASGPHTRRGEAGVAPGRAG